MRTKQYAQQTIIIIVIVVVVVVVVVVKNVLIRVTLINARR